MMVLKNAHLLQNLWQKMHIEIELQLWLMEQISMLIVWIKQDKTKKWKRLKMNRKLGVGKIGQAKQPYLKSLNLLQRLIEASQQLYLSLNLDLPRDRLLLVRNDKNIKKKIPLHIIDLLKLLKKIKALQTMLTVCSFCENKFKD